MVWMTGDGFLLALLALSTGWMLWALISSRFFLVAGLLFGVVLPPMLCWVLGSTTFVAREGRYSLQRPALLSAATKELLSVYRQSHEYWHSNAGEILMLSHFPGHMPVILDRLAGVEVMVSQNEISLLCGNSNTYTLRMAENGNSCSLSWSPVRWKCGSVIWTECLTDLPG
jgi:hypothetical protein